MMSKIVSRVTFSHFVVFGLAGALTLGWWMTPGELPKIIFCPSLLFLKTPCPGCGMTRSFLHLARGHFAEAWRLNAASIPLYFFLWSIFLFEGFTLLKPSFVAVLQKYYKHLTPWLMMIVLLFLLGGWGLRQFF